LRQISIFTIILALIAMALPISASAATLEGKVVALDAGHGGSDPGAVNLNPVHQLYEKDMDRSVADVLKAKLEGDGAKVVDIRPGDENTGLYERANRANASGADILISIHHNSATGGVNGSETYFAGAAGQKLASALNPRLSSGLGTADRGSRQETGFVMTRLPKMPSVITEGSFVTNDAEAQAFKSGGRAQQEAEALHQGINDYFSG
jgi:N-acetylmuramoyl-L-alanine amidase